VRRGVLEIMPLGSSWGRHLLVELPAPREFPYTYCYQSVNNLLCLGEHKGPQVKCRTYFFTVNILLDRTKHNSTHFE